MDPTVWDALKGHSFIRTSRVGYNDIRTPVDEPTLSSALVDTIDHVFGTRSLLEVRWHGIRLLLQVQTPHGGNAQVSLGFLINS